MTCRLGGNFEWEQKSSSGDTVSLALSRFSWGGGGVNERRSSLAYALQSVEERDAGIRSNGTAQGEGLLRCFNHSCLDCDHDELAFARLASHRKVGRAEYKSRCISFHEPCKLEGCATCRSLLVFKPAT
eukprot:scaffold308138_cov17-Tisochrysis_lutea.AAC.2